MSLFEINNLKCSYNGGPCVLEVKKLAVSRGKLVVIVGLSGSGKSTLLETLGLMNNTLVNGSSLKFFPDDNDQGISFEKIWNSKNNGIFEIRRQHFSFIFQNTNLMPNFTVFENICLTQMLQGRTFDESVDRASYYMNLLGLTEIDSHKKSYEISGGQAQRVAFVRAITPDFTVLFGDEPTGNLDEKNSFELMKILKDKIIGDNKTAIIVSHNIELALDFADQIIMIHKTNNHGVIDSRNVFDKSNTTSSWNNDTQKYSSDEMKKLLKDSLTLH